MGIYWGYQCLTKFHHEKTLKVFTKWWHEILVFHFISLIPVKCCRVFVQIKLSRNLGGKIHKLRQLRIVGLGGKTLGKFMIKNIENLRQFSFATGLGEPPPPKKKKKRDGNTDRLFSRNHLFAFKEVKNYSFTVSSKPIFRVITIF